MKHLLHNRRGLSGEEDFFWLRGATNEAVVTILKSVWSSFRSWHEMTTVVEQSPMLVERAGWLLLFKQLTEVGLWIWLLQMRECSADFHARSRLHNDGEREVCCCWIAKIMAGFLRLERRSEAHCIEAHSKVIAGQGQGLGKANSVEKLATDCLQ